MVMPRSPLRPRPHSPTGIEGDHRPLPPSGIEGNDFDGGPDGPTDCDYDVDCGGLPLPDQDLARFGAIVLLEVSFVEPQYLRPW